MKICEYCEEELEDSEFEETKDDTVICKGCAHPSNWDYGTWDHLVYNSL